MAYPFGVEQFAKPKLTPPLYNTSSIFSVGEGTDENGEPLDYSDSIENGQICVTNIKPTNLGDSINPITIRLIKDSEDVLSRKINIELKSNNETYDEYKDGILYQRVDENNDTLPTPIEHEIGEITIPNFIGADGIRVDTSGNIPEITFVYPANVAANIDSLNNQTHEHINSDMPHLIKDLDNNKIYKYGLQVKNGVTQFIYEEVL